MAAVSRNRGLSWTALCALLALDLVSGVTAFAHGDEPHEHAEPAQALPPTTGLELPLSKSLQHAFAITTTPLQSAAGSASQSLLAEVVANPDGRSRLQAPETGRLRSTSASWPVAGRRVRQGEVLAVLEPALGQREQAKRRVDLAGLEQRQRIADINADRLRLQSSAAGGLDASGNTYLEQAVQEAATLKRQVELLRQSLDGHVEIRAGEDGVVQRALVAAGEVVVRGQALFEMAGGRRPLLSVRVHDPALTAADTQASARWADADFVLKLAGHASAAPEPGWNLWLEFADAAPALPVGAPVPVRLLAGVSDDANLHRLPSASVQGQDEQAHVWLHVAPERFQRRAVQVVQAQGDSVLVRATLASSDRIVDSGAALLDQYR